MKQKALLEKRADDRGRLWDVGRDPRKLSPDELIAAGHKPMSPLKALRLRCVDCCGDQLSEVRLCPVIACPSWPFRMGANPWRQKPSEAQHRNARALAEKRRAGVENRPNGGRKIAVPESPAPAVPDDLSSQLDPHKTK